MPDTEFNYDDLPPLVPKGEDRAKIIAEIVEKWCAEPTERDELNEYIVPAYTLKNIALIDGNLGALGEPIDLRELIECTQVELDRLCPDVLDKRKRIISLRYCRIDACNCANLEIIPRFQVFVCRFGDFADFRDAKFGNSADFSRAKFGNSADFSRAIFVQSDFRHCELRNVIVRDTVFSRCRGLYGRDRAKIDAVVDAEWADYRHRFKYTGFPPWIDIMHWARLRSIGTLRLVTASYAVFILITAIVISARWWNGHVTGWQDWAESKRIEEGIVLPLWLDLVEKIPYIAKPAHFGWQLIMLGILAFGATIYTTACPEPIKEASETRWTRELDQPVIEYRAAMYSRFWLRHLCFACYAVGGGYTLYYIAWKGITAIRYLLE